MWREIRITCGQEHGRSLLVPEREGRSPYRIGYRALNGNQTFIIVPNQGYLVKMSPRGRGLGGRDKRLTPLVRSGFLP